MEYPILLLQEFVLIFYTFKYKNLLNTQTYSAAALYATITASIYYRIFPLILLATLVVSKIAKTISTIIDIDIRICSILAILYTNWSDQ